jgi:hypothetical protein
LGCHSACKDIKKIAKTEIIPEEKKLKNAYMPT